MLVFGTRPEAIKMCPLHKELSARKELRTLVCVTGQHRDMLDRVLDRFRVTPDFDLDVMETGQTPSEVTARVLLRLPPLLLRERPDLLLVHGDTATAQAAALAAFHAKIPVGHVEAGLRTYDISSPFPEEYNRRAIALIAAYHFAPTECARDNLLREGIPPSRVFVTGNTAIDALRMTVRTDYVHPLLAWVGERRLLLVTLHRRESHGAPMKRMLRAVRRAVETHSDACAILPLHENPAVRSAAAELAGCDAIRVTSPLPVEDFHNLLMRCYLVLTDSGGVQEEAPFFGKPVLVLRDKTERTEGVTAGTLRLVGTDGEHVLSAVHELLTDRRAYDRMASARNPYGDGYAARRIADCIREHLAPEGEIAKK